MRKIINSLFLVTALLGTFAAKAQTRDTVKTKGWWKHNIAGAAQIQVTYRNTNLDQLNQALAKNNIPSLSGNDIWINLSMSHIHRKWIFEDGLGVTPLSSSTSANNIKAKYGQGQAYFRVGYDVATNSDFRFYPFAGLNFSAAMLNIQDKARTENVTDFSSELLNSTSSKTLYQGNFGVELGMGLDYVIKMKTKQTDCFTIERNIPIGIRAGYYINASQGDWKINDYSLQNGPYKKQNAVFISLNIGLGYNIKKQ